jgi:D-beta-D-heptose 7-phosphate kinase/D-beta-D-heptose 1-phosphate adenosyltransferase
MTEMADESLLRAMARCHVVVVGDLMLDEYYWGEILRISPEAPVPVMHLRHVEQSLGGGANVARNTASLGARVSVIGVIGADRGGAAVIADFDRLGIDLQGVLIEATRPTTRKCRLMSLEHSQQVFRFDEEDAHEIPLATEDRLLALLRDRVSGAHAVVCSDYLKGVLTERVLREAASLARQKGIPLIVAPKDTRPEKYAGATVLMPNLREFARLTTHRENGEATKWMERAASRLLDTHHFSALLVTRGRDGMTLFEKANGELQWEDIASVTQSVYDVTGAGDTALSVFALGVAAGAGRSQAARLANIAAGIVVGKRGTVCVAPRELLERMREVRESWTSVIHARKAAAGTSSAVEAM